ncbi:hypothetical protein DPMN_046958 [Dreissena polymorpha]|uniref:Uncharacterized protein n=1 Tax=Dreissena polymorpha TaxID=45954 RepID=A0A9D4D9I4_DREPO|nr:hypothetical protein DPMN_046958 [Dreissena polymorpha]
MTAHLKVNHYNPIHQTPKKPEKQHSNHYRRTDRRKRRTSLYPMSGTTQYHRHMVIVSASPTNDYRILFPVLFCRDLTFS